MTQEEEPSFDDDTRRQPTEGGVYGVTPMPGGHWPSDVYRLEILPPAEQAIFAHHSLRPFPVWLVGVLNVITFGLFNLIHFGLMHDRLPRIARDDPSAGKAIGFQFIPLFNLYWMFFNSLRFTDRLNLQYRLRGLPNKVPRGFITACCIVSVVPDINIVGILVLWTIGACMLQSAVNELTKLGTYQTMGYGIYKAGI
jgi:hypothetical protein